MKREFISTSFWCFLWTLFFRNLLLHYVPFTFCFSSSYIFFSGMHRWASGSIHGKLRKGSLAIQSHIPRMMRRKIATTDASSGAGRAGSPLRTRLIICKYVYVFKVIRTKCLRLEWLWCFIRQCAALILLFLLFCILSN